jgi:hypothetical protein
MLSKATNDNSTTVLHLSVEVFTGIRFVLMAMLLRGSGEV